MTISGKFISFYVWGMDDTILLFINRDVVNRFASFIILCHSH